MNIDKLTNIMLEATSDNYEACVRLMLKCLSLVQECCPSIALAGIAVANKYWIDNSADAMELNDARVKCWDFLEGESASANTHEKTFCAVRAVICVLYTKPPSEDNGELIDWFLQMLMVITEDIEIIEHKVKSEINY